MSSTIASTAKLGGGSCAARFSSSANGTATPLPADFPSSETPTDERAAEEVVVLIAVGAR